MGRECLETSNHAIFDNGQRERIDNEESDGDGGPGRVFRNGQELGEGGPDTGGPLGEPCAIAHSWINGRQVYRLIRAMATDACRRH